MTRYLSLAEFLVLAEGATGIDAATLIRVIRLELADSALNAPDVDEAVEAMLAVAARQVDEQWMGDWIRQRIMFDVPEE